MVQQPSKPDAAPTSAEGINLEILRHKIYAIALEMAAQLVNAAQLSEINEDRDFATGLVDRQGNVVAIDNPLQLGAMTNCAKDILNYFKFDMKDGDVVFSSDPQRGGTRVTDFTLVKPLFVDNALMLYIVVRSRIPDIGGWIFGSLYPGAQEAFGEGVPFTPVKLHREGRPVRDMITTLLLNSRHPDSIKTALAAMLATLELGVKRVVQLISAYGMKDVERSLSYSQEYVERRVRATIARWQDGVYESCCTLENDGGGAEVTVRVKAHISGDQLSLDFSESDEQRRTFINSTLSTTTGAALLPVLAVIGEDVPANGGLLAAVRIACVPGRVTNATGKIPVGWSVIHCGAEITHAVVQALRQAADLNYASLTAPSTLLFCRPRQDRKKRLDLGVWGIAGASACAGHDGWGRPGASSRSTLPSIEEWESTKNIHIQRIEYVKDSAGAGKWRGAPATQAEISLPPDLLFTLCREGQQQGAAGSLGGAPGCPSVLDIIAENGIAQTIPPSATEIHITGNMLRLTVSSGGGYGPAHERTPEAVLEDVMDGLISQEAAAHTYGVQFTSDGRAIDAAATIQLRKNME